MHVVSEIETNLFDGLFDLNDVFGDRIAGLDRGCFFRSCCLCNRCRSIGFNGDAVIPLRGEIDFGFSSRRFGGSGFVDDGELVGSVGVDGDFVSVGGRPG